MGGGICAKTTSFIPDGLSKTKGAGGRQQNNLESAGGGFYELQRMSEPTAPERTLIYKPASYVERLDWDALFGRRQPTEVELGSGDGSFLAKYATLHPERNFLGVERLLGRLRKLNKKGLRAGLMNLALLRLEASYVIEFMIPPESIDALHVYFPDPWPKRKHRKNRLINERFTDMAANALKVGGIVYLRTDDLDYFQQMTRVFGGNARFGAVETPAELSEVVTDFERNFHLRGVATNRAAYRRIRRL
jgi:tRNA (guanine-N7-)-methyltransferase